MVDRADEYLPAGAQSTTLMAEATVLSVAGIPHTRLVGGDAPSYLGLPGSWPPLWWLPPRRRRHLDGTGNARAQGLEPEMSKPAGERLVLSPRACATAKRRVDAYAWPS
jgi:hypothetical protein